MALQVLTLIWFGMIIRVAYGVLSGKGAQDSRSDDEGEDEDDEVEEVEEEVEIDSFDGTNDSMAKLKEAAPIEEEVDAEALHFRTNSPPANTPRRSSRKSGAGRATAISIPGHGDKKELLGRIGCDKPS